MNTKNNDALDTMDHAARIKEVAPLAEALPAAVVKEPDMPISIYVDEGLGFMVAAREHMPALTAVGMPPELPTTLEWLFLGLQSIQARWNSEQNKGRGETVQKSIELAHETRADALATSDLALRKNSEGQRRLSKIREGEGLPDMVADFVDLAQLYRDAADYFTAIKVDANATADALDRTAKELQGAVASDDAKRSLSTTKDLRDRFYTLTLEPLHDLRAFASFAFRKDKTNNRRAAFASAYIRRQNRKTRAKTAES